MNYTDKNGQLVNEQLLHIQKWNKECYLYTQMPSQNHGLPWGRTAQSLHYKMP